jgi:hypothetical protein
MITQQRVKELFDYEKNGILVRKDTGIPVGWLNNTGYLRVQIDNKAYLVHQVIFLYHYGFIPKIIDHINNSPLDNRIENLRPCTARQNQYNSKRRKDNTSGIKGVTWHGKDGLWHVRCNINGKRKTVARVEDLELAKLVATEARLLYNGRFARME